MRHSFLIALFAILPLTAAEPGYRSLFNGKNMDGWKPSEHPETWTIREGALVAHGTRSHLFYIGDVDGHVFKNYELKVDVMTKPGSNGGIYIDTEYQDGGWPQKGFEIQVNNTYRSDPRKTFSIYEVKDVHEELVPDNQWFTEDITVKGDTITVKYDGKVIVEWTQPSDWKGTGDFSGRRIGPGTIALQAHDPGSEVWYKNIRIRSLD